MGLAGKVVKTTGKAAVNGTKTLTNTAGNVLSGIGNTVKSGLSNAVTSSRSEQADSMMKRVVKDMDTTGKTSDGYEY